MCVSNLVFGHHVGSVDQRRSDGGFVMQRLAQERVVRLTCGSQHKHQVISHRKLKVKGLLSSCFCRC